MTDATHRQPAVRVVELTKDFPGGTRALEGVTFDMPAGELTSIIGPSGCGKTTMLKIIAGLIPATAGEVIVNGVPVAGPCPERAFVFQDFALLPWATVLRNAAFGLELHGVPKNERETTAREYLDVLKEFLSSFNDGPGGDHRLMGLDTTGELDRVEARGPRGNC